MEIFKYFKKNKIKKEGTSWKQSFRYNPDMKLRYQNMLSLLENDEYNAVLDLGCGCQYLKEELSGACKYVGLDQYKHCEDTVCCDFNRKQFPVNEKYDLVVIAGVLEYLHHIDWFITKACSVSSKYVLLSYNFVEFAGKPAPIWLPLKNQKKIFDIFFKNKFKLKRMIGDPVKPVPNLTMYMLFERM